MNWDWTGFINWTNGAFGLGGTVVAFLIGGKVWRVNRIDKASTDAQVAGINAETVAADSVSASLAACCNGCVVPRQGCYTPKRR